MGPRSRIAATLLLVVVLASPAFADGLLLQRLVSAYNAGDVSALPLAPAATLNGEEARSRFAAQFAKAPQRLLLLQLVRCSATRCTANYYQAAGPDLIAGSLTAYLNEQGLIERLVQDNKLWPAGSSQLPVDAGQLADKVSTAAALASGIREANPLLQSASPAGIVGLGAVMVGARHTWVRNLPLSECIEVTRMLAATGWAGGVNNGLILAGLATPVAPVLGAAAGIATWRGNYRDECTDNEFQVAEIR
jgi:hypothetical protein